MDVCKDVVADFIFTLAHLSTMLRHNKITSPAYVMAKVLFWTCLETGPARPGLAQPGHRLSYRWF